MNAPIGVMAASEHIDDAIRAAIRGYRARIGGEPACVYLRPGAPVPAEVDGVPIRHNAHVGLRQALAAAE